MKMFSHVSWIAATLLFTAGVSPSFSAIPVRENGSGVFTFDATPHVTEWATHSVPGSSRQIFSAETMEAAVQSLHVSQIDDEILPTAVLPPLQTGLALWNSEARFIQTKPAGNACTVILATLTNATGSNISQLIVSYRLGADFRNFILPETVPGYRTFFSTQGTPDSWQLISSVSSIESGPVTAVLELGAWSPGSHLYLLWADDNATTETDAGRSIDDFLVTVPRTDGIVAVGAAGVGTNTFDVYQSPGDGWSTIGIPGTAGDYTNTLQLDAAVQTLSAMNIRTALWKEYTAPGIDGGNQIASHNLLTSTLQSRPNGNAANILLATLQNHTGSNVFGLRIRYSFALASSEVAEDIPGFRAYYSLSGVPGEWHPIPELCSSTNQAVNHLLELQDWQPGRLLYLLWADDNGPRGTMNSMFGTEGTYTIDDFAVAPEFVAPRLQAIVSYVGSSTRLELLWRDDAPGFVLQRKAELDDSPWQSLPGAAQVYGGFHHVWMSNPTNSFFRLLRP